MFAFHPPPPVMARIVPPEESDISNGAEDSVSVVRRARAWYIVCARGVAGVAEGANPPRKRERRVVRGCGRGDFVHGRTRANEGSLMGAVVLVLVVDDGR